MSPDDQRAQKGAILLEFQEVEEQINALQVKAKRLGEKIWTFGSLLRESPAHSIMKGDQAHYNIGAGQTAPDILAAMRGWEESFEIADALRKAMHRRVELQKQKAMLGLQ